MSSTGQDASALATGVKVPPDPYQRATQRRSRMITVLDDNAGDVPSVQRALIACGRG